MNFLGSVLLAFLLPLGWAAPNPPREESPQNDELLKNHEGLMAWFGLVGDNFSPLQGQNGDHKKQDGIAAGPIRAAAKDNTSPNGEVSKPLPPPRPQQNPSVGPHPNGHSNHRNSKSAEPTESKVNSGDHKPSSTSSKSPSSHKIGPYPNSYLRPPTLSRPNPEGTGPRGVQGQKEVSSLLTGYPGKTNRSHPKPGRANLGQPRPGPGRTKPGQPGQGQLNPTRQTTPERRPSGGRRIQNRPGTGQMITNRLGFSHRRPNQLGLDQQHPGRISLGQQNQKLPYPGRTRPGLPYSGGTHLGQPYAGRWDHVQTQPQYGRGPSVKPSPPVINQPSTDGPVSEAPEQGKPSQSKSTTRGFASRPGQLRSQMYVLPGHPRHRLPLQHNSYWRRPRHPPLHNWKARRPSNATATKVCSAEGKSGICVTGEHDCQGTVFSRDEKFLCGSSSYKCCPYVSRAEIVQYRKLPFAVTYPGFKCGRPGGEIGRCQEMILECGPGKEASGRCGNSAKAKCCTKSAKFPSP